MLKKIIASTALFAASLIASITAHASVIGYFGGSAAGAITASGNTPVALNNLTSSDLAGIDVLWILNPSNDGYSTTITNNLSDISSFVSSGGVLSFHDRYVSGAASVLPGAAGVSFFRDFTDDANIDIVNNTTLVTNGPGGILTNTSLDGGTSSSHGYADLLSLPAGATAIFSRTATDQIVDFYFGYGSGFVYYSTIPLDYYLAGSGPAAVQANMADIYAPNEAAFQASLKSVPEPASLALLGLGLGALGFMRKRAA